MTCNDDKSEKNSLPNSSSSSFLLYEPMVTNAFNSDASSRLTTPTLSFMHTTNGLNYSHDDYFEFSKPFKSIHTKSATFSTSTTSHSMKRHLNFNNINSNQQESTALFLYEFSSPSEAKKLKETNKRSHYLEDRNFFNMQDNSKQNTSSSPSTTSSSSQLQSHQRNHVVVVEQAPFSVFKSFKSQESIDKVN
jgi:hypothetical protein